ncbi:DUF2796 domain-containing protein [Stutzerimonas stutzeri]|uniref:DUF2796 domain-containing protein n=1 Tax=Stutzerimonas sp. S1 TaxID=3030652 RepID=UPI002225B32A|nr:DUF2796 domain-containing protein [Stutzerimonas sp. S1]MCW3149656.1 DUF2796 domain-containing protein [Stutzerimonas sp. S1]
MRLLLALPFVLLPLSYSQAQDDHHHHDHDVHHDTTSLSAHEHGAARLDVVLDGRTLELQFHSPAMNLLGFEHAPASPADEAQVARTRVQLEQPLTLFGLSTAAACEVSEQELHGELLGSTHAGYQRPDNAPSPSESAAPQQRGHSDIEARYRLACRHPEALHALELRNLFESFPATERIAVQLIGPRGQQGAQLTPSRSQLPF